ncbi:HupE/UreJ family protein [Actinopolymorpha sp. B11F2]|uniref:HupE/UreJ family protein n=1 Tax=Actinopolymorpha sp. B11F2 TaxID=3160862 RepID=UPI0032E5043D
MTVQRLLGQAAVLLGSIVVLFAPAVPADAHDSTTTAYAEVTGTGIDVEAVLELEYDLLMKSAWLYDEAYQATGRAEQLRQLDLNADAVADYIVDRFQVSYDDRRCKARPSGPADVSVRSGRAFAVLTFAYDCDGAAGGVHAIFSALFPDGESFVHSTKTIIHYDVGGVQGSAALDAAQSQQEISSTVKDSPTNDGATVTTREQRLVHQVGAFFVLGCGHLLLGADHLLFVLVLLIGSRGLRDIVTAASAFTAAHSVTFLLAAVGVVDVPANVVEPLIALSIAAVALLHLVRRGAVGQRTTQLRLPVVVVFGLLHGLGFAGALGIDARWSWELLRSLLAFNMGIEVVQLVLIAVLFPLLMLLRRTSVGDRAIATVAVATAAIGMIWFLERTVEG